MQKATTSMMRILNKDEKLLTFAIRGAELFSTCSKRQYMAIITDDHGFILSTGYNGSAKGQPHCIDGGCPRAQEGSANGTNYDNCVAIHAEQNALLHCNYTDIKHGSTMYVNGPPCFTCAKLISNSGITRLVCMGDSAYAKWPEIKMYLLQSGMEIKEINDL